MKKLHTKMAYLQGIAEGIGISQSSKEGRILNEMLKVMAEMTDAISLLKERLEDQDDYLIAMDEDLAEVEDYVEAMDEDMDDVENQLYADELFADQDQDMIRIDDIYDENDYAGGYDDDDQGYFDMECPNCQEIVFIDQNVFADGKVTEILCPACQTVILADEVEEEKVAATESESCGCHSSV